MLGDPEQKPKLPEWLSEIGDKERTPEQEQEFLDWKAAMTAWYTTAKLQRTAKMRFASCLRMAR
ncbi:hypothetical protein, partial [Escherichia coli]|uniref:hypothetical protein n=1 Tax=Escherichia coli TaxID=562 RepID=UPI00215AA52D